MSLRASVWSLLRDLKKGILVLDGLNCEGDAGPTGLWTAVDGTDMWLNWSDLDTSSCNGDNPGICTRLQSLLTSTNGVGRGLRLVLAGCISPRPSSCFTDSRTCLRSSRAASFSSRSRFATSSLAHRSSISNSSVCLEGPLSSFYRNAVRIELAASRKQSTLTATRSNSAAIIGSQFSAVNASILEPGTTSGVKTGTLQSHARRTVEPLKRTFMVRRCPLCPPHRCRHYVRARASVPGR